MNLNCEFVMVSSDYRCNVKNLQFPDYYFEPKFEGYHLVGSSDDDVTKICFRFCEVGKIS